MTTPTPAQQAARRRNWRIFNLRSFHAQCIILTRWRRTLVRWAIDEELKSMGAMTDAQKRAAIEAEWEAIDAAPVAAEFEEIPF